MTDVPSAVNVAWLIPLFPLVGAAFLLLVGKRAGKAAGPLATLMMVASFVTGLVAFIQVTHRPAGERSFIKPVYDWIVSGSFGVSLDLRIDPLSLVMILVVTGVGALIHLYSIGYMHDDPRYPRYFAYLNLFAFSMLLLVLANNFLVLYAGWELVGLCSYLLIGFWFERPSASSAAKKAFITNRVGDLGFAIGIVLIFVSFGSLDYDAVFSQIGSLGGGSATATAIGLLLLAGAAGKSAQIPLHVWLPDAMEGPTPVSALIHAATMVTAGVYMVARSHAIFEASASVGDVVAWIGLATALMAAYIAFVQDDIKRVLAYSTISQLGFMFVGVGVGAYTAGVFHLVTHAFFKALLFLGAGAVMHSLAGETDMTKMGGLARKIPFTATVMIAGWLAIIGFPGTSGFFSKDQILEGAYASGHTVIWVLLLVATAGTGFYMSRMIFLTFFGKSRLESHQHPHESPPVMAFPLGVLAALALVGGLFGLSAHDGKIQHFLAPDAVEADAALGEQGILRQVPADANGPLPPAPEAKDDGLSPLALSATATTAGLAGVAVAGYMYLGAFDWQRRRERAGLAWRAARNRLYIDSFYEFLFTSVGKLVAATLAFVVDAKWIDGVVNNVGRGMTLLSATVRRVQTGLVRTYALGVLAGTVVLVGLLVGRTR